MMGASKSTFAESLRLVLQLTIQEHVICIPGGNIKNWRLSLHSFGFDGMVDFWVHSDEKEDAVLAGFVLPDPIEARLSIQCVHNLPTPTPEPLVVKGLVTRKSLSELSFDEVSGNRVLLRRYRIHFRDSAQVLWRQHFPTALYADVTMRDVLKQHLVEGITLSMSWRALEAERPMICLALGQDEASFYDFLMWFVDSHDGIFSYDYADQTYHLSDSTPHNGRPVQLRGPDVGHIGVLCPETYRFDRRVLNGSSELPGSVTFTREDSASGVHQDVLLRTLIASDVDDRKALEAGRLRRRARELMIDFNQFPTTTLCPGSLMSLAEEFFSEKTCPVGSVYRTCEMSISARAVSQSAEHDRDAPFTEYRVDMTARFENEDEWHPNLAPFVGPRYPVHVEGKIICDIGKSGDRSYMTYRDERTSLEFYRVKVPLWNKDIFVPFEPHLITGHFYIPAFKDSRVLLLLYFDHADIERFLDWGEDVRLPVEGQGNHILLGKNSTSETSVRHMYEDDKPVFTITRVNNGDIELVKMEEGALVLETREDELLKKESEEFDLTVKVAVARSKLTMDAKSSVSGVTGDFEKASSELTSEISQAVSQTKAALQGMKQEVSAKVNEIDASVKAAIVRLSEKTAAMRSDLESAKAELKEKITL